MLRTSPSTAFGIAADRSNERPALLYWMDLHDVLAIIACGLGDEPLSRHAPKLVADLVRDGVDVDRMRIVYRDPDGNWHGLATQDRAFVGYYAFLAEDLAEATWMARQFIQPIVNRPLAETADLAKDPGCHNNVWTGHGAFSLCGLRLVDGKLYPGPTA